MDLLEFAGENFYFDEAIDPDVSALLDQAAADYAQGTAEWPLLRAYFLAPEQLTVLVGLYRFFYYQHRYRECLIVAQRAKEISRRRLNFPENWQDLQIEMIKQVKEEHINLARFYLLTLKGMSYLLLRLERLEEGRAILEKILTLDTEDRLGASVLMDVVKEKTRLQVVVSND